MDSHETNLLDLPNEMLLEVFSFLPINDHLTLSLVNRKLFGITKDVIEKQAKFNMKFPFPNIEIVSKMMRNYNFFYMDYWDFDYEAYKMKSYVNTLKINPKILDLCNSPSSYFYEPSELFTNFIKNNGKLKTIVMDGIFRPLSQILADYSPGVELKNLRASLPIQNFSVPFNSTYLEGLELFNPDDDQIEEIDLVTNLHKFRNIKSFRTFNIRSAERPLEVTHYMRGLNFFKLDNLTDLQLFYTEEISESSPFLCLFQNLESLLCHFQKDDFVYPPESFAFAQQIYNNNWKTLRTLSLTVFGIPQIINFLPSSKLELRELIFFSCDTNDHTKDFLVKLLEQQSKSLEKLSIEGITINWDIFEIITKLEKLKELSFRTCEIDLAGQVFECISLAKLKISFSSIDNKSLKYILESDEIKANIETLQLDDFQRTCNIIEKFEKLVFPKLRCLVYRTYGEGEEVEDFIKKLEAPSLEVLKYGFIWHSVPSFHEFLNLKVLVVQPLYKSIMDIDLLTSLIKLEILEIYVDSIILNDVLDKVCNGFPNLKLCKVKCNSKEEDLKTIFDICENFSKNQLYHFEKHIKEGYISDYVKIMDLRFTIYIHNDTTNGLFYYENLINNFFEF